MGAVKRIWVKRARGGAMDRVSAVRMSPEAGVEGNVGTSTRRQVTLISIESWRDAEDDLGASVNPVARRANVLVEGVDLVDSRGKTLRLGGVEIRLWGETKPCETMDKAHLGLRVALVPTWRGGAHGEIISGGEVAEGDGVEFEESASR